MFSKLMNLNRDRMDPERYRAALREAIQHVEFCLELYRLQHRAGRYFLHEHPAYATSWELPSVRRFIQQTDARVTIADMCTYGMMIEGKLVRKPTRWMTN